MPLNDTTIRGIRPPEKGQKNYIDQHGLTLRVSQGGSKTWVFRHGASGNRISIGKYPIISLAHARQRARELAAEITLHGHKPKSLSFAESLDLFVTNHLKSKNRPSSARETERLLRKSLPHFGRTPLSEITTVQIAAFIDTLSQTPSEANHVYVALKTFLNFSFRRGYIDANPIGRLQKPHREKSRDRTLSPTELRSVLLCAQDVGTTYARLVRLLIYSGQRLGQCVTLTDTHIDRTARTLTWSAAEMKGNENHVVPYHDLTAALLEELPKTGYLFRGDDPLKPFSHFSGSHRAFLKACDVAHFTRHDCRRVYSSIHASLGTPPHLVERLLAHKSGAESGGPVAKIYNRYRYEKECRQACEAYEAYLAELITSP